MNSRQSFINFLNSIDNNENKNVVSAVEKGFYIFCEATAQENDMSVSAILDEREKKRQQGDWFPGSGGTEKPFKTRTGRRLLYVYQPSTGNHAYLDLDTDLILSHEEANFALGM
jgi:hypothetical protein